MTNSELISELFKQQDPIFVDYVFSKNYNMLINLANYIKNKNLIFLPLEKPDFQSLILKSIKGLKNISSDAINRFSYLVILRKIFVQNIINLNKQYLNNKQKILSIANNDIDTYNKTSIDSSLYSNFHNNYDLNNIYKLIKEKLKPYEQKIFKLYLNNIKPNEISKLTKEPIKKIYNTIFLIKNYCNKFFTNYL